MYRHQIEDLERWHGRARRKPLVIRGARQVGKTTLVRLFAERCFEGLAEVNFERDPQLASLFASNDPRATLERLELQLDVDGRRPWAPRPTIASSRSSFSTSG